MKNCSKCQLDKPLDCFAWKQKNVTLQVWCKDCQKDYRKIHYETNRQKYIDKAKRWRTEEKLKFYEWLQTKSCADCGISDIRVLECDHLQDKKFTIAEKNGMISFKELLTEIEKCDIVCSNCHRIRTSDRGNFYQCLTGVTGLHTTLPT